MKKNHLIIGLLLLVAHFCWGQYDLSLTPQDSIWIQKRGFPLEEYDGSNLPVNEELMRAARYRKQSVRCIVVGLPLWYGGGIVYLVGFTQLLSEIASASLLATAHPVRVNNAMLVGAPITLVGCTLTVGGGIGKKARARRSVAKARKQYYSL